MAAMMHRATALLLVPAVLLALAGCSGSKEFKNVDEARAAVQGAGIECGSPEKDESSSYATSSLSCGGSSGLQISLYASEKAFQKNIDAEKSLAFAIAKGMSEYVLHAANWAVFTRTQSTAKTLKESLGGEIEEIKGTGERDLFGS